MSGHWDWTCQSWGSLVAVRYVNHGKNGARWVFRCDCGREKTMPLRFARNGKRPTCGGCSPTLAHETQPTTPAITWPFPRIVRTSGTPVSPIYRAHERSATRI
jgi:hypothetical protein